MGKQMIHTLKLQQLQRHFKIIKERLKLLSEIKEINIRAVGMTDNTQQIEVMYFFVNHLLLLYYIC